MRKLIARLLALWRGPDVVELANKVEGRRLFLVRADGAREAAGKMKSELALRLGGPLSTGNARVITTISAAPCNGSCRFWLVNVEALLLGCIAGEDLRKFQPVRYASDGTVVAMGSDA